jgi:ABC-type phosphate/phosphonate transport system substrate-binding protein
MKEQETLEEGYICPHTKKQCDDECCVSAQNCHIKTSIGVLEETKQETFEDAVKPLMKWLCENTHPHTTAIVTGNLAELVEGVENVHTNEFIVD